jgi:hypothetical protein
MRHFRTYHDPEVAKWVKQLTKDFSNWFLENVGVDHQITIRLLAAGSIIIRTGRAAACFGLQREKPCIDVATWWYFWREDGWVTNRVEARAFILESLAHEFSHYDKWRRGVQWENHRGLQRQVDSMIRKFNNSIGA